MRMRQGPRHEDKKRAEGRPTREEIVDVTSDGKCCGVEITETCVREGSEAGVKGAQNARISQRRFREWDARDDFSVGILPDSAVGVILRASGV